MVEILQGAGHCNRVLISRSIVYPRLEENCAQRKCLMVLNDEGKRARKTLRQITERGILNGGKYQELEGNIYLVDEPDDGMLDSVSLEIEHSKSLVFFMECSDEHADHWGRCTPDGFSCGISDMDVWHKVVDCTGPNPLTVSRSYHMDCDPDWSADEPGQVSDEPVQVSDEQQAMLDLGLPLSFGQNKPLADDEAVITDSCMIEKNYDKELAELSSSTERTSISKSPRAESSDDVEWIPPGTLTQTEFDTYWRLHGERITEESWRKKYGEYMSGYDAEMSKVCSDGEVNEEVSQDFTMDNNPQSQDKLCHDPEVDLGTIYAAAWSKLRRRHAWKVCLQHMNRLLKDDAAVYGNEVPKHSCSGQPRHQETISFNSDGNPVDRGGGGGGGYDDSGQTNEGEEAHCGKRALSFSDFGLVVEGDACNVETLHIKNHKLKKIKKESHHHKRLPLSISADALEDAPKDARLAKYWAQRYRLFRKFDKGIRLNETAWFSVTPEKIAEHIAVRLCPRPVRKSNFVVDAFCGVGGNTIQLALRSYSVLAIDIDMKTIEMAKHNAAVYGVENKIDFVLADMHSFVPRIAPDAVFMSPPWGGPEYKDRAAFDLADMEVNFGEIFRAWQQTSPNIAVILPRNTKVNQLCELGRVEVEQNLLQKKIKTITAYYGNLICK